MIDQVRAFNRAVTHRVGALEDHYLSRDRPLGEARLLWEIGNEGRDIRDLRSRLALDSGYVSRLLRSLEEAGLVKVVPSTYDKRMRMARLTATGRRERSLLDRRSNDLARSMLEPLSESQRDRLTTAMREVEQLLTAGLIRIEPVDPSDRRAQHCLHEYFAELDRRFDTGFDPEATLPADPAEMRLPAGTFLVGMFRGDPVCCGALKFHGSAPAEVKRMWVSDALRGLGLGRRLLSELERRATEHGCPAVRLETNRALVEAIAMYRSSGYREVPPFNDERYGDHWFEKSLGRRGRGRARGANGTRL